MQSLSQTLSFSDFSLLHTSSLLWILLGITFAIFVLVSLVLFYHWQMYGLRNKRIYAAKIVYLIGSVVIFMVALASISLM
jgi:hypothetical protein